MMYGFWDMKHDRQNFLSFWTIFCPFTLPKKPKTQNFEKLKKIPGDIIILWKYAKNHDHMLYCSLAMVHNGCHFFFILGYFCPFNSLTARKIIIKKKKENKAWRYHHFTIVYQKSWWYAILFLRYGVWCDGCNYF